jgi:hypothetical protein
MDRDYEMVAVKVGSVAQECLCRCPLTVPVMVSCAPLVWSLAGSVPEPG